MAVLALEGWIRVGRPVNGEGRRAMFRSWAAALPAGWLPRHAGDDHAILAARHTLYVQARWSRATRDWTPVGAVTLYPERDSVVDQRCIRRGTHCSTRELEQAIRTYLEVDNSAGPV